MKKLVVLFLITIGVGLYGCSQASEIEEEKEIDMTEETQTGNQIKMENINPEEIVAQVDDHKIVGEDLQYEMKRLSLIYMMQGNGPKKDQVSANVALQELIRNHIIHQIAQEHGVFVDKSEQEKRAKSAQQDVETQAGYGSIVEGINENEFWSRESDRYEIIIEAEKLIANLMEDIQQTHPNYNKQALQFDAREDLEEQIQNKLAVADVKVFGQ